MKIVRALAMTVVLVVAASPASGAMPILPEVAPAHRYGTVILDASSSAAGMAPVAFDHWRHRLLYTCRLCHVDVGFATQAGATQISAQTIRAKLHCGACHNGTTQHDGSPIFAACSDSRERPPPAQCGRCHGREARLRQEYAKFARKKPRDGGELIDWLEAERLAFDPPADFVEGVSLHAGRLKIDRNFSITIGGTWLGDVAFSHEQHARWNGCEGCHPEVFPNTSRGAAAYRMKDIVAGNFCGVCHDKVAFPLARCLRCHRTQPDGPR